VIWQACFVTVFSGVYRGGHKAAHHGGHAR
jgi:hypothetical protein